jgi:PIN domain nuclease of toxin-antitoxin system
MGARVKLLLDTCTLLWLTEEPKRLSSACRKAIDKPDNDLMVSDASLWEMALKSNAGKLSFSVPLRRWIADQRSIWKFESLPIREEHILRTLEIERHHVDPFDRILVAQALAENIPVVTPDQEISKYPVQVIW